MRVVVTGCAGFIGSHLCGRLVEDGWEVVGIDAFTPYYDPAEKWANLSPLADEPGFSLVTADLTAVSLETLFDADSIVVHLAAQPGVRVSFGAGFEAGVRDNVLGAQRVMEAALTARCRRLVYASSSSVYGNTDGRPSRERDARRPRSPYGVTKVAAEHLADLYRDLGLDVVGLRYFTVYGPRQRPDMAFRRLCEATADGPPFPLYGDGTQSRDFTFVDDAIEATVRAMTASDPGPVLNVGGGERVSMAEAIELIAELAGAPVPVRHAGAERGDVASTSADTGATRRRLGWAPRTSLAEGLSAELDWVRSRRSVLVGGAVR